MVRNRATIRATTEADLPAILAMQRAFYAEEGYPYDDERMGAALAELLRDSALGRAWLATREGQPVGYLILTYGYSVERGGRVALVDELYARTDARGQGIGSALLTAAEAHCREAGIAARQASPRCCSKSSGATRARIGSTYASGSRLTTAT